MMKSQKYLKSAEKAVSNCLANKELKSLLILSDRSSKSLSDLFCQALETSPTEVLLLQSSHGAVFNGHLSPILEEALQKIKKAVIILPDLVPQKLPAWLENQEDIRILCIATSTPQTFSRWMQTDLLKLTEKTQKLADLLTIGNTLKIQTEDGTLLEAGIKSARGLPDIVNIRHGAPICFLPAGEVRIKIPARRLDGRALVHFKAGEYKPQAPVELLIKKGAIQQIKGKSEFANHIRTFFREHGPQSRQILELSIGTNDHLVYGKSEVEDRKVQGGISLIAGLRKTSKKGQSFHLITLTILNPTLAIDGRKIVAGGELLLN